MSQYYPGQQSDNDIRCDTGIPTRPAPEKPLAADAPGAAASDAAPDERPPAAGDAVSPDEAASAATPAPDAPDAPEAGHAAPQEEAAPSPDAPAPDASASESEAAAAALPPRPVTAATRGTTAHIDPVPDDEDIPVLEVAPPTGRSRPAGRAQQLFQRLAVAGPLTLLVLLAVQIWPIFLTGGRFCPAEWPTVLAALTSLSDGQWLCPSGPQGAQLPLLFWLMSGLHQLLLLAGLSDLLLFPVTSALCGALALLATWLLSRVTGNERGSALAAGRMLLCSLLFPFFAHFMGPPPLATALTRATARMFLPDAPSRIVLAVHADEVHWRTTLGGDTVLIVDDEGTPENAFVVRGSAMRRALARTLRSHVELARSWRSLHERYRDALPQHTTVESWNRLFTAAADDAIERT